MSYLKTSIYSYTQANLNLTEYNYGVRLPLPRLNSRTLPVEMFAYDSGRIGTVIRRDFQIPTIKVEIRSYSSQYSARLSEHPNDLTVNLMELPDNRRLRRHLPNDLLTGFQV
jgi:hypothetical protein